MDFMNFNDFVTDAAAAVAVVVVAVAVAAAVCLCLVLVCSAMLVALEAWMVMVGVIVPQGRS